jgi:hypothetical protein
MVTRMIVQIRTQKNPNRLQSQIIFSLSFLSFLSFPLSLFLSPRTRDPSHLKPSLILTFLSFLPVREREPLPLHTYYPLSPSLLLNSRICLTLPAETEPAPSLTLLSTPLLVLSRNCGPHLLAETTHVGRPQSRRPCFPTWHHQAVSDRSRTKATPLATHQQPHQAFSPQRCRQRPPQQPPVLSLAEQPSVMCHL